MNTFAKIDTSDTLRKRSPQLEAALGVLTQAGWDKTKLFAVEPVLDGMLNSFTADEIRVLANQAVWKNS